MELDWLKKTSGYGEGYATVDRSCSSSLERSAPAQAYGRCLFCATVAGYLSIANIYGLIIASFFVILFGWLDWRLTKRLKDEKEKQN